MKTFVGAIACHLPRPMAATFETKSDAIDGLCDASYSIKQCMTAAQSAFCREAGWRDPDRLDSGYVVEGLKILGQPHEGLPRTYFAGDKKEWYYRTAGGLMFGLSETTRGVEVRVWHPDGSFSHESSLASVLSEAGFTLQGKSAPVA